VARFVTIMLPICGGFDGKIVTIMLPIWLPECGEVCDHYAAKLDAAIGCGGFASFVTIMLPNWLPGSGEFCDHYAAKL